MAPTVRGAQVSHKPQSYMAPPQVKGMRKDEMLFISLSQEYNKSQNENLKSLWDMCMFPVPDAPRTSLVGALRVTVF